MRKSDENPDSNALVKVGSDDIISGDITGVIRPVAISIEGTPESFPAWAVSAHSMLLADHRSEHTQRAYSRDLADFFAFAASIDRTAREAVVTNGMEQSPAFSTTTTAAIWWLASHESGPLALLLNGYKAHLRERSLSEATINRRLAAVRSLLRMARRLGAPCPDPAGLVQSEKVIGYRDTRGPELSAVAQLLASIERKTVQGKRDYALMLLLAENALRRGEMCRANVGDFDPQEKRLSILGKGRGTQKEQITLSPETVAALSVYLLARRESGVTISDISSLFVSCGRGMRASDNRLTGQGLALIVGKYGRKSLGRELHPHALRHMAITAVLDATGGDVRKAQRLSRHKDLRTLAIYDDNRADLQGEATNLLSDLLKKGTEKHGR